MYVQINLKMSVNFTLFIYSLYYLVLLFLNFSADLLYGKGNPSSSCFMVLKIIEFLKSSCLKKWGFKPLFLTSVTVVYLGCCDIFNVFQQLDGVYKF